MADSLVVLGLRLPCTEADVKKAYRRLALQHHPDKAGPSGTERMKEINAAFEHINGSKLWLSGKSDTAPQPKGKPEEGTNSNSGDRAGPSAEQKQRPQPEHKPDRSEQKSSRARPYAKSSKGTYYHPKYGSYVPEASSQKYQNSEGPRFSNAKNQQRTDSYQAKDFSGFGPCPFNGPSQQYRNSNKPRASTSTKPRQSDANRQTSFSGCGAHAFTQPGQQSPNVNERQQPSNNAEPADFDFDFPFRFTDSPFTQEPPDHLWNIFCTDLDTGQRYRQAWTCPSPRGSDPTEEWGHEQFRRAMRRFETHLYFNEPNKINGCFAPDIPSVQQCLLVHEKELNARMKISWIEWRKRFAFTGPLMQSWYRIGELHLLLRLLKMRVAYCYDSELYEQIRQCGLPEMVLGTGVAEMMGPDELNAAKHGFDTSKLKNMDTVCASTSRSILLATTAAWNQIWK